MAGSWDVRAGTSIEDMKAFQRRRQEAETAQAQSHAQALLERVPEMARLPRSRIAEDWRAFVLRAEELRRLDPAVESTSGAMLAQMAMALHHAYGAFESAMARTRRAMEGDAPGSSVGDGPRSCARAPGHPLERLPGGASEHVGIPALLPTRLCRIPRPGATRRAPPGRTRGAPVPGNGLPGTECPSGRSRCVLTGRTTTSPNRLAAALPRGARSRRASAGARRRR